MAGRDPLEYMRRFGPRYWSFHIKDVPQLSATSDTELGKGVIDFRRLLGMIATSTKDLFVEQETYPLLRWRAHGGLHLHITLTF